MRGMLLKGDTAAYIVAVEYLIEEWGQPFEGGLSQWEGSFVPSMPLTLDAPAYILELEDGRRGRISVFQRRAAPGEPLLYRFQGHAGLQRQAEHG